MTFGENHEVCHYDPSRFNCFDGFVQDTASEEFYQNPDVCTFNEGHYNVTATQIDANDDVAEVDEFVEGQYNVTVTQTDANDDVAEVGESGTNDHTLELSIPSAVLDVDTDSEMLDVFANVDKGMLDNWDQFDDALCDDIL